MYMQAHFSALWLRMLTEPDSAKRQTAHELLELLAQAVFVDGDAQGWSHQLPSVPFRLNGVDYSAVPLGKNVDTDTIEYLDYDYDGIELFLLRPDSPSTQRAQFAVRRTLNRRQDHFLLDLGRLSTSFLTELHSRILQVVPRTYNKEHQDLRMQAQREVAARNSVV